MKYRVIGNHAVRGTAPGEMFEADLSPYEEETLVVGGHIERVKTHRYKAGEFSEEPVTGPADSQGG